MLENDLTNIEMLIMKCIWDTPEELALSQLVTMVNERFDKNWRPQTISTYLAHLVRKKLSYHAQIWKSFFIIRK